MQRDYRRAQPHLPNHRQGNPTRPDRAWPWPAAQNLSRGPAGREDRRGHRHPFAQKDDDVRDDPLYQPVRVIDFAPLAKAKLDPVAWDYLDGGSEDEVALADNRAAFNRIVMRPRALVDVHHIDLSVELLGQTLAYPILLDPAGGKNCFYPDGENVVARAAANANALHITNGGIEKVAASGKGPAWWQIETGGSLRSHE